MIVFLLVYTGVVGMLVALFLAGLWLAGLRLTPISERTRLGSALRHVIASLAVFLGTLAGLFLLRVAGAGPGDLWGPHWLEVALRWLLAGSETWLFLALCFATPALIERVRKGHLDGSGLP